MGRFSRATITPRELSTTPRHASSGFPRRIGEIRTSHPGRIAIVSDHGQDHCEYPLPGGTAATRESEGSDLELPRPAGNGQREAADAEHDDRRGHARGPSFP